MQVIVGNDGISIEYKGDSQKTKRNKGKSLTVIPSSYTIIDIETTGLDPSYDEIIEIGALKIKEGIVVDEFQSLIKPDCNYIDEFIAKLTGITNEMLKTAPRIKEVLPRFIKFIQNDILVGHNINFDINFLYDNLMESLGYKLENDFVDLMRLSRKVYPELKNHKLVTVAKNLDINIEDNHRALGDCRITYECFLKIFRCISENNIDLNSLYKHKHTDLRSLTADKTKINVEHPLYDKYCTFTGQLERMTRKEAAQLVVNLGGYCLNGVTKQTSFLIMGNFDYCSNVKGGKSSKLKKTEKLILDGQDLQILSENVFYDLVTNN